jgi:hypothetical protein
VQSKSNPFHQVPATKVFRLLLELVPLLAQLLLSALRILLNLM